MLLRAFSSADVHLVLLNSGSFDLKTFQVSHLLSDCLLWLFVRPSSSQLLFLLVLLLNTSYGSFVCSLHGSCQVFLFSGSSVFKVLVLVVLFFLALCMALLSSECLFRGLF